MTMLCIFLFLFNQVNHSQALSARQPELWLLIRRDGIVKLAHCTCMAGLGEACSHIGAVLYYVKAVSKFNRGQASTGVENIWLPAYIKNVPCALFSSIDFASAKSKKRRLDTSRQPATKKGATGGQANRQGICLIPEGSQQCRTEGSHLLSD